MDQSAWLGLVLGVVIGAVYGLLQRRGLGKGPDPYKVGGAFLGATVRLVGLMIAVFLALRFAGADKLWLVGGLMVAYGVVFGISMLGTLVKKTDTK
jgi:hypothetical protein